MSEELASGQRVGPYRLLFRLGKGGMGEVWAAQKAASFGFERLVALKLLRGAEADSNAAVMFFDEARAAAALNHASIVATTDLGQYGNTFYLAMGMIRGPSLTALLQRLAVQKRPLPPAVVAYIGERMASALDYAYERAEIDGRKLRLVHRDISPHNVLIDEDGNVMLSDFGVARTAVQDHESRVGTVRGKPSYMAPEQVRGGAMDARTDLFALGICLYEAACVKRLFGRSNPVKSMDAVVNYEPKPLPTLVPDFPEALWKVIEKSLQKAPEDRYQSAADMGRALAEVNKTLPGATTAARDLAALIAEVFPVGSFNIDARVAEALAQAGVNEPQEATQVGQRNAAPGQFAEVVGTGAWPTAIPNADPLDPEALLEMQAAMAAAPQAQLFSPTASGSMPSYQGSYPQVTATQSQSRSSALAVVAISAAALSAAVAVYWVSSRPPQTVNIETPTPTAPILAPGAIGGNPIAVTPSATAEPPKPTRAPTAPPSTPAPSRSKGPETSSKPVATQEPAPSSAPPKPAHNEPATRESVASIIMGISDKSVKSKLFAALSEAGSDEQALAKIRDQALAAQGPN